MRIRDALHAGQPGGCQGKETDIWRSRGPAPRAEEKSKPLFEDFLRKRGIDFWPTTANFIFCYFAEPVKLEAALRERGILVRPKKDHKGVLGLRVSFGTLEQMHRVVKALEELL